MPKSDLKPAGGFDASRFVPVLLLLFAGSGCSALIYEIVWYQLLQLVIGSTAVSLGVLLATFMGGLCFGSLALPRMLAGKKDHPLRIYGKIEIGIAICGVLVLFGMPLVDGVYTTAVGHGMPSILFRALICAICLLPPTFLMGASLPAIARWIETSPRGVSWLGLLYGGNTAGAVFGCLLAGFYLLRVFDLATATYVAAAINLAVAFFSFMLANRTPHHSTDTPFIEPATPKRIYWPVYATIALSGATALGAEVVWTRLMGLLLGATVYTFSIILAVFLVGIGIGSGLGAMLSRSLRARTALGVSQLLLAGAVAWTAFMISDSLPWWPVNPLLSGSPWFTFQIDLVRVLWTIFPATLLWGASFPLALAAASTGEEEPGRLVGGIYAANTGGAIVGALAFSLILVPAIGTANCERVLIALAAISACFVLIPAMLAARGMVATAAVLLSLGGAAYLMGSVHPVPPLLIAYGRRIMINRDSSKILYTGEGINSSIAISQWNDGAIQFHVSGKVEASTEPYDMRLQRMLGHMPALIHRDPKSVLIVGFGAGVTAGSFVTYPSISRIVICEMEPLIPPTATKYFAAQNYNVMNDPRTTIHYDDARHFVLTTPDKFDIITSDPIHPWVKGSATLYSKEYFEMVKKHLNPGGVVTQWVPLYESDFETVKSEIATFFDVFPGGSIWANELNGGGYDVYLMGQNEPTQIDMDSVQGKLSSPEYARVAQSLRDVGFNSAIDLFATYAGEDQDLRGWLHDAAINRDGNLRLQYLAGLALNISAEGAIYNQMLSYRQFPFNLFKGSEQTLRNLAAAMGPRQP
ncbi:MAG TPA: fused MFS/spermidine synthase [Candidatus Limnocylindrales bacterium]|nr:fused MFS/spermidine synthase [Candidatus Limnocylindrales bacterium]